MPKRDHDDGPAFKQSIPGNINRRMLLKTLVTCSGTAALGAILPGNWVKPVIGIGVLPAHAQTSCSGGAASGSISF